MTNKVGRLAPAADGYVFYLASSCSFFHHLSADWQFEGLSGLASGRVPFYSLYGFVARHFGKAEHPQNLSPALGPFLAVLKTIFEPQIGQT